jgi:hypothetical protein
MSRRETILLGGLAVAGLAYLFVATREGSLVGSGGPPGGMAPAGPAGDAPVVKLDLLSRAAEPYDPNGRDLFKYTDRPQTAEEIRALRAAAEAQRKADLMAQKVAEENAARQAEEMRKRAEYLAANPPPPPKPQPPPITFRYIGLLGPKEKHLAVFEEGKDIFVAGKGDVVKGQFRVIDFKYETVVMGYTRPEFVNERQELRMVTK